MMAAPRDFRPKGVFGPVAISMPGRDDCSTPLAQPRALARPKGGPAKPDFLPQEEPAHGGHVAVASTRRDDLDGDKRIRRGLQPGGTAGRVLPSGIEFALAGQAPSGV